MENLLIKELDEKDYLVDLEEFFKIEFCPIERIYELIDFLKINWKNDHIFVTSKKLLDWQHLDIENNRYNFIIASDKKTNEICSILGFVPSNHFDKNIKNILVWPCIWKVKDGVNKKGLGISLYKFMLNNINIESISILGISEIALSIYKKWEFETGKIKHYFILNESIIDYKLIDNYSDYINNCKKSHNKTQEIDKICTEDFYSKEIELFVSKNATKYKSFNYYVNRFIKHPSYNYTIYTLKEDGILKSIFVIRDCINLKNKAMRIVDFVGDLTTISNCYKSFQDILVNENAEYIDFIVVGVTLEHLGFENKQNTNLIIPNYFEPFVMKNVELDYAFKSIDNNIERIFVKADADQDRPNV